MDDSLRALEERLEQLVPKGLSDFGRERMEDQIDELAGVLEETGSGEGWKWGIGAVAAVVAMVVVFWGPGEAPSRVVVSEVSPVQGERDEFVKMPDGDQLDGLLTISSVRHVEERTDQGWVMSDGAGSPHRYWSYAVTDEEQLMDQASGYEVRVVSQREEWVPIEVTSL